MEQKIVIIRKKKDWSANLVIFKTSKLGYFILIA
jgi:hypothetical protein